MEEDIDTSPLIENNNPPKEVNSTIMSKNQILEKTFPEKFCFCCINYDLSNEEYTSYITLLKKSISLYNESDPSHENLLNTLFEKASSIIKNNNNTTIPQKLEEENTQAETINIDTNNKDNINNINNNYNLLVEKEKNDNDNDKKGYKTEEEYIWRTLGFQSGNPRNDFRAGGLFSLQFMIYFLEHYPTESQSIISDIYFPFALSSIRLSYLTRVFLLLLPKDEISVCIKSNKFLIASRKEIKNFGTILVDHSDILFDILCHSLIFVFNKFLKMKNEEEKEINYLLIEPIIGNTIQEIQISLYNVNYFTNNNNKNDNNSNNKNQILINWLDNDFKEKLKI